MLLFAQAAQPTMATDVKLSAALIIFESDIKRE
jgi:hypothetical protein